MSAITTSSSFNKSHGLKHAVADSPDPFVGVQHRDGNFPVSYCGAASTLSASIFRLTNCVAKARKSPTAPGCGRAADGLSKSFLPSAANNLSVAGFFRSDTRPATDQGEAFEDFMGTVVGPCASPNLHQVSISVVCCCALGRKWGGWFSPMAIRPNQFARALVPNTRDHRADMAAERQGRCLRLHGLSTLPFAPNHKWSVKPDPRVN